MSEFQATFIRNTPERRAAIFQIKLMFDEAHRLREEGNIPAYGKQIGLIDLAFANIDPESTPTERYKAAESVEGFYAQCTRANRDFLDKQLKSMGKILIHFENRLRTGFEVEMTERAGLEQGWHKFI